MPEPSAAAFPQIRNSLKRSASTASLPTPPRTHRKRARGRSRGSCDSDSDDAVALLSEADETCGPSKKRRTEAVVDDEDAFWLGAPAAAQSKTNRSAQAVPLPYRKAAGRSVQADVVSVAPVSPPPSSRKRSAKFSTALVTPKTSPIAVDKKAHIASPPSTPKRLPTRRALRDSPDNPFLATPVADSDSPGVTESSADPSPRTPSYDKPYINYVFRGTRRTYQNPHYNHAEGRPLSPPPASRLPIDHPEYSPSEACAPKRLFRRKNEKSPGPGYMTRSRTKQRSLSSSSNEGAESVLELRPKKLDFRESGNKSPGKRTRGAAGNLLM